jgi:3-isopropylmalate/(R)-2-methylmalate dehydratase small subunit
MKKTIRGLAYVLGDHVDTDQIIPAEHLVYSLSEPEERKLYGRYALSSVPPEGAGLPEGYCPFVEPGAVRSRYAVVVGGVNFGCGSSREHAPFALREAGVEAVVAASYARIFYRNAVDGGLLAPFETPTPLNTVTRTGDDVEIDTVLGTLTNLTAGEQYALHPLGDVAGILEAGGVFEYARRQGLLPA